MNLTKGVDVYFRHGDINWPLVRNDNIRFAFIRWGQRDGGRWLDSKRVQNWTQAKGEVLRSPYYVWDARDGATGEEHGYTFANDFSKQVGYDFPELPTVADLQLEPLDWSEFRIMLLIIEEFFGRRPIIYAGAWFLERVLPLPDWVLEYDWWLTGYNDEGPTLLDGYDLNVVCWQQSETGRVNGINRAVDINYWLGDLWRYAMNDKYVSINKLLDFFTQNSVECGNVPQPPPVDSFALSSPLTGELDSYRLTQDFNENYKWYKSIGGHDGLDWGIPVGTPILASHPGKVTVSGYRPGRDDYDPYGDHVRIILDALDHKNVKRTYTTIYAHLNRLDVAIGETVKAGTQVGLSGGIGSRKGNSDGPHLHFGVICHGAKGRGETFLNYDFMNPWIWLKPDWIIEPIQGRITKTGLRIRNHPTIFGTITRCIMIKGMTFPVYHISGGWGAHDMSHTAWSSLNSLYSKEL